MQVGACQHARLKRPRIADAEEERGATHPQKTQRREIAAQIDTPARRDLADGLSDGCQDLAALRRWT
jgi:hypothetical protein